MSSGNGPDHPDRADSPSLEELLAPVTAYVQQNRHSGPPPPTTGPIVPQNTVASNAQPDRSYQAYHAGDQIEDAAHGFGASSRVVEGPQDVGTHTNPINVDDDDDLYADPPPIVHPSGTPGNALGPILAASNTQQNTAPIPHIPQPQPALGQNTATAGPPQPLRLLSGQVITPTGWTPPPPVARPVPQPLQLLSGAVIAPTTLPPPAPRPGRGGRSTGSRAVASSSSAGQATFPPPAAPHGQGAQTQTAASGPLPPIGLNSAAPAAQTATLVTQATPAQHAASHAGTLRGPTNFDNSATDPVLLQSLVPAIDAQATTSTNEVAREPPTTREDSPSTAEDVEVPEAFEQRFGDDGGVGVTDTLVANIEGYESPETLTVAEEPHQEAPTPVPGRHPPQSVRGATVQPSVSGPATAPAHVAGDDMFSAANLAAFDARFDNEPEDEEEAKQKEEKDDEDDEGDEDEDDDEELEDFNSRE
ncbi:hypothetical protein BU16DRAFT_560175 [Lophium mytilinum]|uniref:Uncharacterized protein n=1 Tax=Lophium mytilinum TaxID=390894 RepID=A0A6A6QXA8_9PEZI|nr:hypothetical protein BU16DRAFT_560175 [Lophium mytilinum]